MSCKTPALILLELCKKMASAPPEYKLIHHEERKYTNKFSYHVSVLGTSAAGEGGSHKEAKQATARNVLKKLKELKIYEERKVEPTNMANNSTEVVELNPLVNYIEVLENLCFYYSLPPPEYSKILQAGPPHDMIFTYECHVGSFITRAKANTKKEVCQIVAEEMVDRLADIVPELKSLQLYEGKYDLSVLTKVNLGIEVQTYSKNLRDVMKEKNIKFDDIKMYLNDMNEIKLASLLGKFEMEYSFKNVTQHNDIITVILDIPADAPLGTMGQSVDLITARDMALSRMSEVLTVLLNPTHEK